MNNKALIDKLNAEKTLSLEEWTALLSSYSTEERDYAANIAREISLARFGRGIFIRGIVEFTSFCRCDCYYCGIRASNCDAERYRLDDETILSSCRAGYQAGFRTFVLQGGEDMTFTDARIVGLIENIKREFSDCALTLSIGERPRASYEAYFRAGANRFLLRHETATKAHYELLHPAKQSFEERMRCLRDLHEIGYQTGCGMMVGTPYQTSEHLARDMRFMREFEPEMIGMGPFIPHHGTPFANEKPGSVELTLFLLSLCRIMLPSVLLPATTALGTLDSDGRKLGVLAGANVIMPNLTPLTDRRKYALYDNKAISGEDAAESLGILRKHMEDIGYHLVIGRGDYRKDNVSV